MKTSLATEYHPSPLVAIAIYGVLSGQLGLIWAFSWNPAWTQAHWSDRILGFMGMPIDGMLLVSSAAILMLKPWAREWMLRWAVIATVFATLQLVCGAIWPMTAQDITDMVPAEMREQVKDVDPDMVLATVKLCNWIGWLSTLSLSLWAFWAMRKQSLLPYFETEHGKPPQAIPKIPPARRAN